MNSIFILIFLIIILSIFLIKQLNFKKSFTYCIFITFLIILFVLNIETSINAAKDGCILCFNAVIPTVFAFSIICNLLISYDGISIYSKILGPLLCKPLRLNPKCSFPIVASILCGYPLGAKYSTDLYNLGHIDFNEYTRLLNIASNAGPIFIIGSVGTSLLGDPKYGYFLLISNFVSMLFIALITLNKQKTNKTVKTLEKETVTPNFGISLDFAISNALKTTLSVCSYIVAFSVIISIVKNSSILSQFIGNIESFLSLPKNSLYGGLLGSMEMTNGCNIIANSDLSIYLKLAIISFFCSFSGLSVIAQISSFTSKNGVNTLKYSALKLLQGCFSFILTFFLSKLIFTSTTTSTKAPYIINYNESYLIIYFILLFLFMFLPLIYKILSKKVYKKRQTF